MSLKHLPQLDPEGLLRLETLLLLEFLEFPDLEAEELVMRVMNQRRSSVLEILIAVFAHKVVVEAGSQIATVPGP